MTVEIGKWNGIQEPVLTIFNEHDLRIIRIGDDYSPVSVDFEFEVKDVAFLPNSSPSQYQVFYLKTYFEDDYSVGPWKGYRWDADQQKFKDDLTSKILCLLSMTPKKLLRWLMRLPH